MNVITDREIKYSNAYGYNAIDGDYSNLDANSTIDEVKRFQSWLYSNKEIKLLGGKFDSDTSSNYQKYGNEYETTYNKDFDKKNAEADTNTMPTYTQGGKYGGSVLKEYIVPTTKVNKEDKTKKDNGLNSTKKKLSTTSKVLIGLGIALVLGTTIYFIIKKK